MTAVAAFNLLAGNLTEQVTMQDEEEIVDFLAGKPGNYVDSLIVTTVRFKGWGEGFEAEDVIQNTRLTLLKKFKEGGYRSQELTAFVRQVARIQCLREIRRHYTTVKHLEKLYPLAGERPDPDPGILDSMLESERRLQGVKVLGMLDKRCLQLLLFKFHDDLSYKEIGDCLGLSEANARVSVFRCLKKSRKILRKMEKKTVMNDKHS